MSLTSFDAFLSLLGPAGPGSGGDVGDLDLGVLLPVALPLAVAGLVLVLHDRDLGALGRAEHLTGDRRGAERVRSRGDLLAVHQHDHGKADRVTHLLGNLVDLDDVTDSNLLLLAATAHDRVHRGLTLFVGLVTLPEFLLRPRHAPHAHGSGGMAASTHDGACAPTTKSTDRAPAGQNGRAGQRLRPRFFTGTCTCSNGGSCVSAAPGPWSSGLPAEPEAPLTEAPGLA